MTNPLLTLTGTLEGRIKSALEGIQNPQTTLPQILPLLGHLLASEVYCEVKAMGSIKKDTYECYLEYILTYIRLKVFSSASGELYAKIDYRAPSRKKIFNCYNIDKDIYPLSDDDDEPNGVRHDKDGNTYYIIRNLNIYLTADVVQQLNINPQQVINQLHEQIKEEIDRVGKCDEKT